MAVPSSLFQWNSSWSMLFLPWVVWSMMPPWQDITLLTTFVISQVLLYSMQHMRGTLILSTLVLLLWTKSLLSRWYRTQTLTREFFKRLLYMVLTILASLAAVLLVWMPLYEAYACVVSKLDRATAKQAMDWRNTIFLIAAVCLAISSIAQTDLVLKPSQMDNAGLTWMMRKVTLFIYRCLRYVLRDAVAILRTAERCVHAGYKQRTRRSGSIKRHQDMSDDDATDDCTQELRKQSDSTVQNATRSCRQTRRPASRRRKKRNIRKVSPTDLPCTSYTTLVPNWLKSLGICSKPPDPLSKDSLTDSHTKIKRESSTKTPLIESSNADTSEHSQQTTSRLKSTYVFDKIFQFAQHYMNPSRAAQSVVNTTSQCLQQSVSPIPEAQSVVQTTSQCLQQSVIPTSLQQSVIPTSQTRSVINTISQCLLQSVIPTSQTRSIINTASQCLQRSVIPTSQTRSVVKTTSQCLLQSVIPTRQTRSVVKTTSQCLQQSMSPTRQTRSVVKTTSQCLQQSMIPTHQTRSVVKTTSQCLLQCVIPTHQTRSVVKTTSQCLQQSMSPRPQTRSVVKTTSQCLQQSMSPTPKKQSVIDTTSQLLKQSVHPKPQSNISDEALQQRISFRLKTRKVSDTSPPLKQSVTRKRKISSTTQQTFRRMRKPRRDTQSVIYTRSQLLLQSMHPERKTSSARNKTRQIAKYRNRAGEKTRSFIDTSPCPQKNITPRQKTQSVVDTSQNLQKNINTEGDVALAIDAISHLLQQSAISRTETSGPSQKTRKPRRITRFKICSPLKTTD